MPTLIVPDRRNTDIQALRDAALRLGWEAETLPYRLPERFAPKEPVLYGDALFCELMAAQLGVRLVEPSDDFLVRLPEAWRQRWVQLTTLAQARQWKSGPVFIKPANDKSFPAAVYASGSELPEGEETTPVLLSEPVHWEVEWRLFIREGKVSTRSPYFRDGKLDFAPRPRELEELRAFSQALLEEVAPLLPPTVVLDLGKIAGRGWAVVEANPAWASGLYRCDPARVLQALADATVPNSTQSPWLRPAISLE